MYFFLFKIAKNKLKGNTYETLYTTFSCTSLSAIVVNNNSPAQVFDVNTEHISIFQNVSNNIDYSISYLKNGKIRKEEYYFGSGYLSQSSRFYPIYNYIKSFEFIDRNSKKERFNIDEK